MNVKTTDFYNMLKQAVMFSPDGDVCKRLQTFRVLEKERGIDLVTPNMGAVICDKGRPYFWSRDWHNAKYNPNKITFSFPALCIFEYNFQTEFPASESPKKCVNFQIAVFDVWREDCAKGKCTGCAGRVVSEIYDDTEALLFSALKFVSGVSYATLSPSGEGWYNKQMLEFMVTNGDITSFSTAENFGAKFSSALKQQNTYRIALDAERIYGTAIDVTVCFSACQTTEYNFNLPDFGVLAAEAGCNCCG